MPGPKVPQNCPLLIAASMVKDTLEYKQARGFFISTQTAAPYSRRHSRSADEVRSTARGKWSSWTTLVLTSAAANCSASKNSTASANSRNATEELQGILWDGSAEKGWSSWLYLLGCN